jgi:hypothetical protein
MTTKKKDAKIVGRRATAVSKSGNQQPLIIAGCAAINRWQLVGQGKETGKVAEGVPALAPCAHDTHVCCHCNETELCKS